MKLDIPCLWCHWSDKSQYLNKVDQYEPGCLGLRSSYISGQLKLLCSVERNNAGNLHNATIVNTQ